MRKLGYIGGLAYLSGSGTLVIKDVIMLALGLIVASDSAKQVLSTEN